MKNTLKESLGYFTTGAVAAALIILIYSAYQPTPGSPKPCEPIEIITEVQVPVEVEVQVEGLLVALTIADMYEDLATRYKHISKPNRDLIMVSIAKAADKYNISPLVLYNLVAVESSFRWWIEHPLVTVQNYEGKSVKTRAIGLGGIVFEIWGPKLKEAGVIDTKSDLFQIDKNIDSIGYVYSYLKSKPLHPKASHATESGLIRYFGGGYKGYFDKIDAEIASMLKNKLYGE